MFKHHRYESMTEEELIRVETDAGRFYKDTDGNLYQSVTTWLGNFSTFDFSAWQNAVGEKEAHQISRLAASKGTNIHLACERFLNNEENPGRDLILDEIHDFKLLKPVLVSSIDTVIAQEIRMKSKKLKLAGTADCIAIVDEKLSIVDFKTSKRYKSAEDIWSYWIQTAAYAIMAYEMWGIMSTQLVIIMVINQERVLVYKQDAKPWIREVMKLAKQTENNNVRTN